MNKRWTKEKEKLLFSFLAYIAIHKHTWPVPKNFPGLQKKVPSSCPGQVDFLSDWASNFSFSFTSWAKDQARCLSTMSLKGQTMSYPGGRAT